MKLLSAPKTKICCSSITDLGYNCCVGAQPFKIFKGFYCRTHVTQIMNFMRRVPLLDELHIELACTLQQLPFG
jgi:hypothetical protein